MRVEILEVHPGEGDLIRYRDVHDMSGAEYEVTLTELLMAAENWSSVVALVQTVEGFPEDSE